MASAQPGSRRVLSKGGKRSVWRRAPMKMAAKLLLPLFLAGTVGIYLYLAGGEEGGGVSGNGSVTDASGNLSENDLDESFQVLVGRWIRPDGGYIIEVRSVAASGVMDVGYYNPRPIHVAVATASVAEKGARVFIELQDVGYPGATYELMHDPERNVLVGFYHQPAVGQTFEVLFVPFR